MKSKISICAVVLTFGLTVFTLGCDSGTKAEISAEKDHQNRQQGE